MDANATAAARHRQCQLSTFPLSSFFILRSRRLFAAPLLLSLHKHTKTLAPTVHFRGITPPLRRGGHLHSAASVCLWKRGRRTAGENYDGGKNTESGELLA